MMKWFGRSDVLQLVNDTSVDSCMNEAFFQCQCIVTRERVEKPHSPMHIPLSVICNILSLAHVLFDVNCDDGV